MEIQTIDFQRNGTHFSSVVVLLARAWTNNAGLSKVRNSRWLGKGPKQIFVFGRRRDSQSRKQNGWRNCVPFQGQKPLAHFWTDIRFGIFSACRSGVYVVFQKQLKQNVCEAPGPPEAGACWASDATSCFGGRSRERSIFDRCCSESIKHETQFDQRSRIESRRHPQKSSIDRRPETLD